jgi:hypothetical protein
MEQSWRQCSSKMTPNEKMYQGYLQAWLDKADYNAYHYLIESGEDCAIWLKTQIQSFKTPSQKIKLIEVLKEFRFVEIQNLLLTECLDADPKIWKAALEGLAYQGLKNLRDILLTLKKTPDISGNTEKTSRIEDILMTT